MAAGDPHCHIGPPAYMLVKIDDRSIQLPGLPAGIVPLQPQSTSYSPSPNKGVKLFQFPVTLGYAVMDWKCQGKTYTYGAVADLKRPATGFSPSSSPYVQLSRATHLHRISIMRLFDPDQLRIPLSNDLVGELKWQDHMAKQTREWYRDAVTSD